MTEPDRTKQSIKDLTRAIQEAEIEQEHLRPRDQVTLKHPVEEFTFVPEKSPELLQRLRPKSARPRRPIKIVYKPPVLHRVKSRYEAHLAMALDPLVKAIEQYVLPEYEGWVDSARERLPTFKQDVHVKKPGSRGGHIIGYRHGEPIYGTKSYGEKIINPSKIKSHRTGEPVSKHQDISRVHVAVAPNRAWFLETYKNHLELTPDEPFRLRWLVLQGKFIMWSGAVDHGTMAGHLNKEKRMPDYAAGYIFVRSPSRAKFEIFSGTTDQQSKARKELKEILHVDTIQSNEVDWHIDAQPTEAQIKAGNYPMHHIRMHGFEISIENKKGTVRSGKSKEGKKWSVKMAHDYGYIRRTEGADDDHLDVFIGPYPKSEKVFVVYQIDPQTKRFDEHKVMFGFKNLADAKAGYLANYEKGWKGIGKIKELTVDEFKDWLDEADLKIDVHVKKPGSRGGHIIGYSPKGEPIYGHKPYGKRIINPHKIKSESGKLVKQHQDISKVHVAVNPTRNWWIRAYSISTDYKVDWMRWLKYKGDLVVWTGAVTHGVMAKHLGADDSFINSSKFIGGAVQFWTPSKASVYTVYGISEKNTGWAKKEFRKITRVDALHQDDEYEVISAIFGRIRMGLLERETPIAASARYAAQLAAAAVSGRNLESIKPVLERVLKVDPFQSEPWLLPEARNWIQENVSLIRSVASSHLDDVEKLIYRMVREGKPIKEVREELADRFGVSKSRARLIARDQVNKYNGRLTKVRQQNVGIKEYKWFNVQDVRVRGEPAKSSGGKYPKAVPAHTIMHEVRCRWDNPGVYHNGKKWVPRTGKMPKVHPGSAINCRCLGLPILPDWMVQ